MKKLGDWVKANKLATFVFGVVVLFVLFSDNSTSSSVFNQSSAYQPIQQYTPPVQPTASTSQPPNLSNTNTYTNSVGNTVHSPAYTNDNSVPVGASAQCRDGTYSFSQSRRGTCSHHGGVASWL